MNLKRMPSCVLAVSAVALMLIALVGCGGGGESSESQAYNEVLSELENAALSKATYHAVRRAKDLEPVNEAVVEGFCRTIREMVLNHEDPQAYKYPPIGRIGRMSQMELREMKLNVNPHLVRGAMTELREAVDLASLSTDLNRRYVKACYS